MNAECTTRVGERIWAGIDGTDLGAGLRQHLEELRPGGIVLFRRNIQALAQCRALVTALREVLGPHLRVAVDQEGGLVERFHGLLPSFPGNMALGAIGVRDAAMAAHLAREQGRLLGLLLRDLGIDVNFAPDLDLAVTGANPSTGLRSFGCHAGLAGQLGAAFIAGQLDAGVLPCAKHFPGLGSATVDSHLDLPTVRAESQESALQPFRAAFEAGVPLVMTSHVIYEALDPEAPATFSSYIVGGLLRGKLGFRGVAVTDDLEMGAMQRRYAFPAVVRRAGATHDVLTICSERGLQCAARDELAMALEDDAFRAAHEQSLARLAALPRSLLQERVDATALLREAEAVAEAIAGRGIAVVRDEGRLLPLTGAIDVILPVRDAGSPVEDPLRGESDARELQAGLGAAVRVLEVAARPTADDLAAAVARAGEASALVLVLTAATQRTEQRELARAILARRPATVVVALRSPFDLACAEDCRAATLVASHGFRPVQLRALARVLRGTTRCFGRLAIQPGSAP